MAVDVPEFREQEFFIPVVLWNRNATQCVRRVVPDENEELS